MIVPTYAVDSSDPFFFPEGFSKAIPLGGIALDNCSDSSDPNHH